MGDLRPSYRESRSLGVDAPLVGRDAEVWELVGFTTERRVHSPVRCVVGERGIGKTRLLDEVAGRLSGRVTHVDGATEIDRAVAEHVSASGAAASVIIVDDLDHMADDDWRRILFAGRRLPRGMRLLASADAPFLPNAVSAGIGVSVIEPLAVRETGHLLDAIAGEALADHVREHLIRQSRGNPRAAIDLVGGLSARALSGNDDLPEVLEVSPRSATYWLSGEGESSGVARALAALLPDPRRWWVRAAAEAAGVDLPLSRWTDDGVLVRDDSRVTFVAPVLRSAFASSTTEEESRYAAEALARVLPPDRADQAAWLRSIGVNRPDPTVAAELTATEPVALRRGGAGASARVLGRAAALSPSAVDSSRLRVRAAHAAWQAGARAQAAELLRMAHPIEDHDVQATAALVTGALALGGGDPRTAAEQMLQGARAAETEHPDLALDMLARLTGAAMWEGRADLLDRVAATLPRSASDSVYGRLVARTARAAACVVRGDFSELPALIRELEDAGPALDTPRQLVFAAEAGGLLGDDDAAMRFLLRASRPGPGSPSRAEAAFALELLAHVNIWQGRLEAASQAATAGLRVARSLGESQKGPFPIGMLAHVAALRGDHGECASLAAQARRAASGVEPSTVTWARGRAALSRGDFEAAHEIFAATVGARNPLVTLYATPDIVEAAAETGRWSGVEDAVAAFESWALSGSTWARSILPRIRALRTRDDDAVVSLVDSLAHGGVRAGTFDEARTRLVLGRILRRLRRRPEAREHLRAAAAGFEHLGLRGWVARAHAELRAAGESMGMRDDGLAVLSDQEREIARMIGGGASNRAAAERLHLSHRTIEYHLGKIYVKLNVANRAQLASLFADGQSEGADASPSSVRSADSASAI